MNAEENMPPEPSPVSTDILFNYTDFLDRMLGDTELTNQILKDFTSSAITEIATLRHYINTTDNAATTAQAHKLKGAFSNIGSQIMADIAGQIEKVGPTENYALMKKDCDTLEQLYKQLQIQITAQLKNQENGENR